MSDSVRLTHPSHGGEFVAVSEAVPAWEAQGWERVGKKPTKPMKQEDADNG